MCAAQIWSRCIAIRVHGDRTHCYQVAYDCVRFVANESDDHKVVAGSGCGGKIRGEEADP
jgi:hypothetical protein